MAEERYLCSSSLGTECKIAPEISEIRTVYAPDLSPGDLSVGEITEFDLILNGNGIHQILDQALPCAQGEIYIVPPHVPHAFFLTQRDDSLTVRRLFFRVEDWFDGEITEEGNPRYCFGVFADGSTVSYAKLTGQVKQRVSFFTDTIERELSEQRSDWKEAVRSLLGLLLIEVGRCVGDAIKSVPPAPQKDRGIIASAIRITMDRYAESDFSLKTIANSLFISQSFLSRMFRRYTGWQFSVFLRNTRIEHACKLLRETDETVGEIVVQCGLRDIPTFYRAFSCARGMTPNQYRNRMRHSDQIKQETGETGMSILNEISENLQAGKAKVVKELVEKALEEGIPAGQILEGGLLVGMGIVGEKFKNNEVYIPEVLIAARALNMGTQVLKPHFTAGENTVVGRVCIGTVQGDLHDIGKNLVKMMMEGKQLEVIDLGTDVSAETFVKTAVEQNCQIICCSALLTTTMDVMKQVVDEAVKAGIRDKVKIMIGGAPVNEDYCRKIGADVYTVDAASAADAAVELCRVLKEEK